MRAVIVLLPEESKKLIARAVVQLPEIISALKTGTTIIAGGTTNGFIARELTGQTLDIYRYTAGRVFRGELSTTSKEERIAPIILIKGILSDISMETALEGFTVNDVFIKGANAVDPQGNVGVLAANPRGGTVGIFWPTVIARGANLICPVGLEKLIPSVETACIETGQEKLTYSMGLKVGLLPLAGAKVVTEIQALELLYQVQATHIASGGISGSEGSVVLSVKGEKVQIEKMWKEINQIKC